jgi:hypothetical protein
LLGFLKISGFIYITRSEASRLIMADFSYTSNQFNYNEAKVQFANTLPMSNVNSYFASTINPHVDVASFDNSRHIASASTYSDGVNYANYNSELYIQKPMSNNMHALSFNDTSNIQHYTNTPTVQQVQKSTNMYQGQNMVSSANYYGTSHTSNFSNIQQGVSSMHSSAGNSMYMIMPQNLSVNEKVGYANSSHPTSYSQTSCATNLYNIQQGRDESVFKYSELFKEIMSQYFNLYISDSDLAFGGLKPSIRDSLKGIDFHSLASVHVRATAHELRIKKDENNSNLMNVQSGFVTSKESSLAAQEHVKHNKTTILDFSKAEGVVHFSSDYRIIG